MLHNIHGIDLVSFPCSQCRVMLWCRDNDTIDHWAVPEWKDEDNSVMSLCSAASLVVFITVALMAAFSLAGWPLSGGEFFCDALPTVSRKVPARSLARGHAPLKQVRRRMRAGPGRRLHGGQVRTLANPLALSQKCLADAKPAVAGPLAKPATLSSS